MDNSKGKLYRDGGVNGVATRNQYLFSYGRCKRMCRNDHG